METEITAFNPWLEIWYRPRQTIRRIVDTNPNKYIWLLVLLSGTGSLFVDYAALSFGEDPEMFYSLLGIRLLLWGVLWAIVSVQISAYSTSKIGRMLGGNASVAEARAAGMWSSLPIIVCYHLVWLPQIPLLQAQMAGESMSIGATLALVLIFVFRLIAGFWGLYLHVVMVAEVSRFTVGRAIVTMLCSSVVVAIAFYILSFCLDALGIIY